MEVGSFKSLSFEGAGTVWMLGSGPGSGRSVDLGQIAQLCGRADMAAQAAWMGVVGGAGLCRRVGAPGFITCLVLVLADGGSVRGRRFLPAGSVVVLTSPSGYSGRKLDLRDRTVAAMVVPLLEAPFWSPCSAVGRLTSPRWLLMVISVVSR